MKPPCFLTHLDLRLAGKGKWLTCGPLGYQSALYEPLLWVPDRFFTDLASVPRIPFAYMIAGGRIPAEATLHDYLYQWPEWQDRELADAILYEAMGVNQPDLGMEPESWIIRQTIWAGVRAGGWYAWNRHRQRGAALNPKWTTTEWPQA